MTTLAIPLPAIGTVVTFHLVIAHVCGGRACCCDEVASVALPARVVAHAPPRASTELDQSALVLDVDLTEDAIAAGYASRQTYSVRATTTPPASGTWSSAATA